MQKQTPVEWLFAHLLPHLDWSKRENRILFRQLEQEALNMEEESQLPQQEICISCDEQKETYKICMDCIGKMIKENQK